MDAFPALITPSNTTLLYTPLLCGVCGYLMMWPWPSLVTACSNHIISLHLVHIDSVHADSTDVLILCVHVLSDGLNTLLEQTGIDSRYVYSKSISHRKTCPFSLQIWLNRFLTTFVTSSLQKWMQMPLYLSLSMWVSFRMVIKGQSARIVIKHGRISSFMHA